MWDCGIPMSRRRSTEIRSAASRGSSSGYDRDATARADSVSYSRVRTARESPAVRSIVPSKK